MRLSSADFLIVNDDFTELSVIGSLKVAVIFEFVGTLIAPVIGEVDFTVGGVLSVAVPPHALKTKRIPIMIGNGTNNFFFMFLSLI